MATTSLYLQKKAQEVKTTSDAADGLFSKFTYTNK